MRIIICAISVLLSSTAISAQDLHSKKKKAIEGYQQAVILKNAGNFYASEEILKEVLSRDDSFDEAILLLHQVYINRGSLESSEEVLDRYGTELELKFLNRVLADQSYFLMTSGFYQLAAEKFAQINGPTFNLGQEFIEDIQNQIEFARAQLANPLAIEFELLPLPLNRFDMQYFPSITLSNQLVFTVRKPGSRGDEDIFRSQLVNGNWLEPQPLSGKINSSRNEGTASIAADGRTLVFTACNRPENIGGCDLYISYVIGEEWSEPELLSEKVNSPQWDSQPSLSQDGQTLYFTSRRPGGYGKQDIWMSTKKNNEWTAAVNLGASINTQEDDASPFIFLDNKTLIFATKGRLGMGGFDLFKSTKGKGGWSDPKNLGYPINNAFDQVGYSISAEGWAYFSSSLEDGRLRLNRFKFPEKLLEIALQKFKFVEQGQKPLRVKKISLKFTNSEFEEILLNDTFTYQCFADESWDSVLVKAKGYMPLKVSINPKDELQWIELTPYEVNGLLFESTGYFEFSQDKLTEQFKIELEEISMLLNDNKELHIEVAGHTDMVGSSTFNKALSIKRATNVANYLMQNGVSPDRISVVGYGETRPKSASSTLKKEQSNRRVEIHIKSIERE